MRNTSRRLQKRGVRVGLFTLLLAFLLMGQHEWADSMKKNHNSVSRFLYVSPPLVPSGLGGPAPSFVVSLYPVCLLKNSPHLPKLNVLPIFCWDSDWYAEPRHFD